MKYLATDLMVDKEKFIVEVWDQIKPFANIKASDESLVYDTVLYFLDWKEHRILSLVLQVLSLALKKSGIGKVPAQYQEIIDRLLDLSLQP